MTRRAEVERKLAQHLGIPIGSVAPDFIDYWVSKGLTADQICDIAQNVPPPQRKDTK